LKRSSTKIAIRVAVLATGVKDSAVALYQVLNEGYQVACLARMIPLRAVTGLEGEFKQGHSMLFRNLIDDTAFHSLAREESMRRLFLTLLSSREG
jgi:diphthamide synthase (EF-2-diphthine--ammonia ligase)